MPWVLIDRRRERLRGGAWGFLLGMSATVFGILAIATLPDDPPARTPQPATPEHMEQEQELPLFLKT